MCRLSRLLVMRRRERMWPWRKGHLGTGTELGVVDLRGE